jgi:ATP-binding cassette subfamily B protein
VDTVSQTLNQSLTQIVTSITMIIGILIMMFSISWQMTLVSLVLVPLSFILIAVIVKRSQHYFKEQQDSLGEINGHIEEMYAGHNVMRVFNGEKQSVEKFKKINAKLYGSAWMSQFLSGLMMPVMTFVGNLGFVGVSVLGGWLVIQGKIQIGDIQAFIQYVNQFNQPIIQSANIANVMQSTAAAGERVFEFLGEKEESTEDEKSIVLQDVKGGVEFDNVVFGYDKDKTIIKGFSAHIRPGQKIAIVGPTGAGKTTMVNLLMRFYEVNRGTIKIDGVDTGEMKRSDVRKLFGMVLQDTWLFNGTIRENIAYGKPNATVEEIVAAASAAHADHFIHALPQGYDLKLNEEADNISQGEKQLLTIARAMLIKTPMLILDEATSSVDTRTELLIQKAMENLMKGKTSFVIAHRLSTIRNADLILVMKDGNIVEQGKHEELLARKGFYESLYNSQFTASSTVLS